MRYALYFTPPEHDPLCRMASRWLGRNAFTGEALAAPVAGVLEPAEMAFHTAAARRYGFHATLKAPFALAPGQTEQGLIAALAAYCAATEPVIGAKLALRRLDGFLALVPETRSPEIERLAGDVVVAFDHFRAPISDREIDRRNPDSLSPAQLKNLHQWGYPYVFESFRFHMTLTGRVDQRDAPKVMRAIEEFLGPVLDKPLEIASLALFAEPEPGAPFTVRSFHHLGGALQRKTA